MQGLERFEAAIDDVFQRLWLLNLRKLDEECDRMLQQLVFTREKVQQRWRWSACVHACTCVCVCWGRGRGRGKGEEGNETEFVLRNSTV